jgi:hypothetical protein
MNGSEDIEDIEKQIKKLQESGEEQRIFEENCKKSMLREYYINRTEIFMKTKDAECVISKQNIT